MVNDVDLVRFCMLHNWLAASGFTLFLQGVMLGEPVTASCGIILLAMSALLFAVAAWIFGA